MGRQARAETTRRRIIDSAVDLINEIGYPAAGLGDIIDRAELTKGALYYHFESKEALASSIIDEGVGTALDAFRAAAGAGSPALESAVRGAFAIADVVASDRTAQAAQRLLRTFGGFNASARLGLLTLTNAMGARLTAAGHEGDLRSGLDVESVAATVMGAILGADLLADALDGGPDLRRRVGDALILLLPALVDDGSLPYYREYVTRQGGHHPSAPHTADWA